MKKNFAFLILLITCTVTVSFAQERNYGAVKKELASGWNTWSTYSMGQHVLLPHGFSINLALHKRSKSTDGFVNRFFLNKKANGWKKPIVTPSYHSYNGDYTSMDVTFQGVKCRVESAVFDNDFYLLVTPLETDPKYEMVTLFEGGLVWNKGGSIAVTENQIVMANTETKVNISAAGEVLDEPFFDTHSPYLAMVLDKPIGISTVNADIKDIQEKVELKKEEYKKYINQFGDLAESYAAMSSCLAWNTIYDARNDRVFTTVDRGWNKSRGGYVFFGWDNFFMAHMIGLDNPELGMANAIEALNEVTGEGFVANMSQANGRKSWDRSQPPVGSMMSWEIYQKHSEKWFLEEVYPKLIRWNEWWLEKRMNGDLLAWGSHISKNPYFDKRYNTQLAAMLETGIDDSPMYVDVKFDAGKGVMEMHDVGLNAMYIGDCDALMKMAEVLGKKDDVKTLKKRKKQFVKSIQSLWNAENFLFQNLDLTTKAFSNRISPTSFYPMISGTASPEQAKSMVEQHMLNEAEFWGDWVLPSISKDDPLYPKQKYWKGAIWAPMNFLVYLGMRDYPGLENERKELVSKSLEIFNQNWLKHGYVCENYSPIDGSCTHERLQSSAWYTWGGMMAIMGLMEEGYY